MLAESLGWEFDILHWAQTLHNPVLDFIMAAFSFLGEAAPLVIIAVVLSLIPRYRKCGISMLAGLILSVIFCNGILKPLVARERPYWIDGDLLAQIEALKNSVPSWLHVIIPTDYSFPSGHTSASFASALAIFMVRKKEGVVAILIAACIAISRIYIGIHYPTDVMVSLVLGTVCGICGALIVRFAWKKIAQMQLAKNKEN